MRGKGTYGITTARVEMALDYREPRKTSWVAREVGISVSKASECLRYLAKLGIAERVNTGSGEGIWRRLREHATWQLQYQPAKPTKPRLWFEI